MKKEIETVIATNGKAYHVNHKTGKAKKVFNSLTELRSIKAELVENRAVSFNAYVSYLRNELPSEPIKIVRNTFMIKGYKFIFHSDHIECKDVLNFSTVVSFKGLPTPKDMLTFLNCKKRERKFTPDELKAAAEKGKLLTEKSKVDVKEVAKVDTTESLLQAKQKALRLITRVKKRQSDNKKIFEEIPGMINYRPLQTSIGIVISYYHKKKLRWSQLLDRIESIIKNETFEPKKPTPEKFFGVDIMQYKKVEPMPEISEMIGVDGRVREAGEFFARYILQKDNKPEVMPQMMKWLRKEITDEEFIEAPVVKDKMVAFDCKLLKGLTKQQVEVLHEIIYVVELWDPTRLLYNEHGKYKVGQKIKAYSPELGIIEEGEIVSVEKEIMVKYGKDTYPLISSQIVKFIK